MHKSGAYSSGAPEIHIFSLVMNIQNKLECLSLATIFQNGLIFAGNDEVYSSWAPEIHIFFFVHNDQTK